MSEFIRFPRTPHLSWLGAGTPRDDKVLKQAEARSMLSGEVVVEEKVDGANLGLSVSDAGTLRAQNRGAYLDLTTASGQWAPLMSWLPVHRKALMEALAPNLILFGEWCYAVHTLRYTKLPDWFLAFDVYDRREQSFWSVDRRNALTRQLGLAVVPEVARGHFSVDELRRFASQSMLTEGPCEGVYVRREANGRLLQRAKVVTPEFSQTIDEHWSRRRIEANELAPETLVPRSAPG